MKHCVNKTNNLYRSLTINITCPLRAFVLGHHCVTGTMTCYFGIMNYYSWYHEISSMVLLGGEIILHVQVNANTNYEIRHVNESLILYCIFKDVYMYFTSPSTGIIYAIPSQEPKVCFFQQHLAFSIFGGIKWIPFLLLESKSSFIYDCYITTNNHWY